MDQNNWMQYVEADRSVDVQEALRSYDADMEEADEVWKLMDEIEVELYNIKDTLVAKYIQIDRIMKSSNESQTLIAEK